MAEFLYAHDGHVALFQVVLLVAALGLAGGPLWRAWSEVGLRTRVVFVALGLAAMLLSLLLFPSERYDPLGHEASYFECFRGQQTPSNSGGWHPFVTYPILRWTYWLIGGLVGRDSGPGVLVGLNAAASGLGVLLFAWFARVWSERDEVGIAAGVLLALHPVHAFWGAAIFHTAIPHALVVACLLLSVLAWRTGCARLLLAAAACGTTMAALRIEWSLLAPALAVLLLGLGASWGRHPGVKTVRFWAPALGLTALGGLLIFALAGPLTQQGGYHGVSGYLATIGRQAGFLEIFEPWHGGLPLVAAVVGAVAWGMRRPGVGWRGPLALLGFVLIGHLGLATFNDYGYRHALLPSLGLLTAASYTAAGLRVDLGIARAFSAALLAAAVVTSVLGLRTAADRYYASEESFRDVTLAFSQLKEIPHASLEDGSCYLITDNERLWDQSRARLAETRGEDAMVGSHFNLMDPGEAVSHYRSHRGCVRWLYDVSQYRWDSLGPRVRAAKMHYWFEWQEEGWTRFPDGMDAVVYKLQRPPWGVTDDQPIPPTEFVLPGLDDPEPESELESEP